MKYIIEGTVTEVTVKNDKTVGFKIAGTEGYAVKQDGKSYNVLCLKDKIIGSAYIREQADEFVAEENYLTILQTAISSSKKVRIELEANEVNAENKEAANPELPIRKTKPSFKITSISLLSE